MEAVAGSSGGAPGSVRLAGGRAVTAGCAVVVATEARSAEALLGPALTASPSKAEPGVGTCNLYFRWVLPAPYAKYVPMYVSDACLEPHYHRWTSFYPVLICGKLAVAFC